MTKRLILILAAVGLVTASVAAYYRGNGSTPESKFTTATISRGAIVDSVDATGTLEAVTTVAVGTQVSGTIKSLDADYNSRVRKGQVIAQLEPSIFQAQVEQARATVQRLQADVDAARVRLADTRAKYVRAQELAARQLIPASDLETAQTTALAAESSLKAAEAQLVQGRASLRSSDVNLGHTTIKAPIDGVVISRNVDVGQTVAASMSAPTLFVLAQDLRHMQVNASIDESDISGRHLHRHRQAGAPGAGRRAERRHLRDGHRRAESGSQAQAGHDGERDDRGRASRRGAARAERRPQLPADARDVRPGASR
jgi:HlyD family secretion protein